MTREYDNLDDAAAAALYMLGLQRPTSEHLALLYGDDLQRTPFQTRGGVKRVKGAFQIPQGSLRALMHNHPTQRGAHKFSETDMTEATRLGVPSYISAGDRVRRFDPTSGETSEVLAQFPMDEYRAYLMQKLLNRAPDDPRGLLK